ncbi:hypothetical protein LCGC14_3014510, partial [marine sediment metagenome]
MAEAYKILGQGELPAAAAALYTVPGATEAIIKHIKLINQTAGALTITLWIDGTTDPFLWMPSTTEIPANGSIEFSGSLSLEAAAVINGATAGGANDITYIISG